ncbi:MAG: ATP-binding cassette domain-containing protein, partial [Pseudobdellovibrionaceae bacterium]
VGSLSGGEQSRLLIAKLMLPDAQLLILDEPTKDLDMESLNVLQECLVSFNGADILVSHDRFFMDQVVDTLFAFSGDNGEIIKFAGYFQWEEWFDKNRSSIQKKKKAREAEEATAALKQFHKEVQGIASPKSKLSQKERFEFEKIEGKIAEEEALLVKLQAELGSPETLADYKKLGELTQKVHEQESKVQTLIARWEELSSRT